MSYADMNVERLRCEYRIDPVGLDVAAPRLSWILVSARRGVSQSAYRILVASSAVKLAADEGDLWDSGKVVSDQTLHVEYAGKVLASRQQCWWKAMAWDQDGKASAWSKPASWTMGLLKASDWQSNWIAAEAQGTEPVMMRKEFAVRGSVRRATVYATALGLYELRLNGQRVGDALLAPECTLYKKRIQYQTYDVTGLIANGSNALAAHVAEGWYAGYVFLRDGPAGRPMRLLAQVEVEYADGQVETIATDGSWRVLSSSPIRRAEIYSGESYDAREECPGWDRPGFDDAAWKPAQTVDGLPGAALVAQPNDPIRVTREVAPVAVTRDEHGAHIVDFGQNLVGWCRLKVSGPAGTKITLRHGEVLDGVNLYTANLRKAKQTVEYTLRGGGVETWEPHFTYCGFRYVEVTGWPGDFDKDALVARAVRSDAPEVGQFECSNSMLNQLMSNIFWTQRGNMHSMPTDCPQRDERLGWTGDIQAFSQTAIFNMDMGAFFTKWVADLRDSQSDDGRFPDFAPSYSDVNKAYRGLPPWRGIFAGVPAWGDAGTVVPWRVYQNYGDVRLLEQHFESARRWIDIIHSYNPGFLWESERGNDYGDWLNGDVVKIAGFPEKISEIPKDVFATAFFAHSTVIVAKMARVLGRSEDAAKYARLHQEIRTAFRKAYVDADGKIKGDTQAGYALALHFDLLAEEQRPKALTHLQAAIERYKGHASTGIQSTHRMLMELSAAGRHDEAYRLATLRDAPSWGYSIEQGATTIWERWDGFVKGRGLQDPGMNSFNHYALGSVGEWMWRELAGIQLDEQQPGYKHFVIQPRPAGDLKWVKARYDSIRGPIEVQWEVADGVIRLSVTVPVNATATIHIPTTDPAKVTESGKLVGLAVCEVGSGCYTYCAPYLDGSRK